MAKGHIQRTMDWLGSWFSKHPDLQTHLSDSPSEIPPSTKESDVCATFLKQYLDFLEGDRGFLKLKGLPTGQLAQSIPLDEVYVALKGYSGQERENSTEKDGGSGREQIFLANEESGFLASTFYQEGEGVASKVEMETLFVQHPRLVILGEAGSGKSTLLDQLILKLIRTPERFPTKSEGQLRPLPIFFPLRQLNPERLPVPEEFSDFCIPRILQEYYPSGFFKRYMDAGACFFLFDGLDEISDTKKRSKVRSWIDQLAVAFGEGNRFVVTSRIAGYHHVPLRNGFEPFRLADFDADDIKIHAYLWQGALQRRTAGDTDATHREKVKNKADELLEKLDESPAIRRLAANPLLMTIIMLVFNNRNARLPKERGRLYNECVNVLLEYLIQALEDDADPGAYQPDLGLRVDQQRELLNFMAVWLHRQRLREAPIDTLCQDLLAPRLPPMGKIPGVAPIFLDNLEKFSGLMVCFGANAGFSHLTFQEYFTALALTDEDPSETVSFLVAHRFDPWWREVTQLYAGSINQPDDLIRQLLEVPDTPLQHSLLLAGACLADAVKVLDLNLRRQVVAALANLYRSSAFYSQRDRARQMLVRIGTHEVAEVFIPLIAQDSQDIFGLRDAVEILSRLPGNIQLVEQRNLETILVDFLSLHHVTEPFKIIAIRGLRNLRRILADTVDVLWDLGFSGQQLASVQKEAIIAVSELVPGKVTVDRLRSDILENVAFADTLDPVYVAALKGVIRHIPGPEALALIRNKLDIPKSSSYKVDLCRMLPLADVDKEELLTNLFEFLEQGIDWGTRGGAALTLGTWKDKRPVIAQRLSACLQEEGNIGVRLRIAEALGFLGWQGEEVCERVQTAIKLEVHPQVRWKLVESFARLTRQEAFIKNEIISRILPKPGNAPSDGKWGSFGNEDCLQALSVLNRLRYYTPANGLTKDLINRLPAYPTPIARGALAYLAGVPDILEQDKPILLAYLQQTMNDEKADLVLRNQAFETLYNLLDLLVDPSQGLESMFSVFAVDRNKQG